MKKKRRPSEDSEQIAVLGESVQIVRKVYMRVPYMWLRILRFNRWVSLRDDPVKGRKIPQSDLEAIVRKFRNDESESDPFGIL